MPDPARLAQFDQLMAKGSDAVDAIVARVRRDLGVLPEHAVVAGLSRQLDLDPEAANALATVAVLRLAKAGDADQLLGVPAASDPWPDAPLADEIGE